MPKASGAAALEEVSVSEGLLRLRVPRGWSAGREEDGTHTFFDPQREDGVLRVKVLTFTSDETLTPDVAFSELEAMESEPGQSLERLRSGNALRVHREEAEAGGEPTVLHVWMLAGIDPPHRMRLAVLSFAVLTRHAADPALAKVTETLDREIRKARFSHQLA